MTSIYHKMGGVVCSIVVKVNRHGKVSFSGSDRLVRYKQVYWKVLEKIQSHRITVSNLNEQSLPQVQPQNLMADNDPEEADEQDSQQLSMSSRHLDSIFMNENWA
jgi:FMN-dependent NADH-azoreductase